MPDEKQKEPSPQPGLWAFSKSITPGQGAGRKLSAVGWRVTRLVWGTAFCLILLGLLWSLKP